jgi:hypothetical protein
MLQTILGGVGRYVIGIVVVLVIGGAIAFVFREHLSNPAAELRVGDCFEQPANSEDIKEVQHRPCGDPHDAEVFLVRNHEAEKGASHISEAAALAYVQEHCIPAFGQYIGTSYETDTLYDIGYFHPTADSWTRHDDRGFTCYVVRLDRAKLTGSVKAAPSSPAP